MPHARPRGPEAARLFRLLGLHPGPDVAAPAAASLVGRPVAQTRDCWPLSLGNHTRVVDELAHLAAQHPGRQRLTAQLMLAMHRAGRSAQALHEYAAVRQRLDDELGLEPSAELQRLHLAILRDDKDLQDFFGGM